MSEPLALPAPRLEVVDLAAGYGTLPVLFDVSLHVGDGEIVALLGPNGAGKTTCLRAIAGLVPPTGGSVLLDGRPAERLGPERTARLGVQFIPEGGGVLRGLSVTENLLLSGWRSARKRSVLAPRLERAFDLFPPLAERRHQSAATLSGGERQMLALAQAAMTDARLLLVDEASLGLAPRLVTALFEIVVRLRDEGRSVLLVEQHAHLALEVAGRAYVMEKGRIVGGGRTGAAVGVDVLTRLYLDAHEVGSLAISRSDTSIDVGNPP